MSQPADIVEGWKAIGEALGLSSSGTALRKRLHRWEVREGLPVHRICRRVFATVPALQAWSSMGHNVPLRAIK
jgi:hypothetical protein